MAGHATPSFPIKVEHVKARFGSIATVQLKGGNDWLLVNCFQLIVQRPVQDATAKLTKNDGSVTVAVIIISEHDELVAEQSALED